MLSIIIPVKNEYENLEAIDSQFRNNFDNINYEVLLINDFSEDNTLQKAEEICLNNKKIAIYNKNNFLEKRYPCE